MDWVVFLTFLALAGASSWSWWMADNALDKVESNRKDTARELAAQSRDRAAQLKKEADARTAQFCRLINSTHADRKRRYLNARMYLRSPGGREKTLLNDYIRRVSLPQTRQEIRVESNRIPPVCRAHR